MANIEDITSINTSVTDDSSGSTIADGDINVYDWNEIDFNGIQSIEPVVPIDRTSTSTSISDNTGIDTSISDITSTDTSISDSGSTASVSWGEGGVTWGDGDFTWAGYRV